MRQIGHIENESAARTFGDFLYVRGVENQIEFEKDSGWAVWVLAEENLDRARELLTEFRAEPDHPRFRAQAAGAAEAREQARQEREAYAQKVKDGRQTFAPLYGVGFGPLTLLLIVGCVVVAAFSSLGDKIDPIIKLFYSEEGRGFPEIRHGEVWRLVTPIFIHFGFMHIFFNLLWLRDLGSALELRLGSLQLGLQVLVIAILSNTAQYLLGGPAFGGMSGVVYGLLGYIWVRSRRDPSFGMALHPSTMTMMLIWFVLCWTGLLGHIANWCHTAGLLTGAAWGFLAARKNR